LLHRIDCLGESSIRRKYQQEIFRCLPAFLTVQTQVREEVSFTDGQIIVKGKTVKGGKPKRADYILYYRHNISLAVTEAKDNNHSVGDLRARGYPKTKKSVNSLV
tara:strand:+ start:676 stop:990 length:315 start_codon:yes stop_codon:yes gene_type:complete